MGQRRKRKENSWVRQLDQAAFIIFPVSYLLSLSVFLMLNF